MTGRNNIITQKKAFFLATSFFRLSNKLVKAPIEQLTLLKMFPVRLVKKSYKDINLIMIIGIIQFGR